MAHRLHAHGPTMAQHACRDGSFLMQQLVDHEPATSTSLRGLIEGIEFAMLTTVDRDGCLHSRPMAALVPQSNRELWFFISASSAKAEDVRNNQAVNVTYTSSTHHRYVAVSGRAELVFDRDRARRLWQPAYRTWFPLGVDDPDLALLRIKVDKAECWDAPNARVVQLLSVVDDPEPAVAGSPSDSPTDAATGRAWQREQSGRLLLCLEHLFLLHVGRPH